MITDTDVHVAALNRRGEVRLDGELIGAVTRRVDNLFIARTADGELIGGRYGAKSSAVAALVRDRLAIGDRYRITGLPSATGGPWTIA